MGQLAPLHTGKFKHLWKTDKRDFILVLLAFTCTLFWGLLVGRGTTLRRQMAIIQVQLAQGIPLRPARPII